MISQLLSELYFSGEAAHRGRKQAGLAKTQGRLFGTEKSPKVEQCSTIECDQRCIPLGIFLLTCASGRRARAGGL
jgi:hypothetical protein